MKIIRNIVTYASWIHEIFHWIPARLLGMKINAGPDHVIFDLSDNQVKNILVVMGPFAAFMALFIFLACLVNSGALDSGWLFPAGFLWASCIWDAYDFIRYLKTGEWDHVR